MLRTQFHSACLLLSMNHDCSNTARTAARKPRAFLSARPVHTGSTDKRTERSCYSDFYVEVCFVMGAGYFNIFKLGNKFIKERSNWRKASYAKAEFPPSRKQLDASRIFTTHLRLYHTQFRFLFPLEGYYYYIIDECKPRYCVRFFLEFNLTSLQLFLFVFHYAGV